MYKDLLAIEEKRRTCRRYSSKRVEESDLLKILDAGRLAPSALNLQPTRLKIINKDEDLELVKEFCTFGYDEKIANIASECSSDKIHNIYYYGAKTVIMVCYDKDVAWVNPTNNKSSGEIDSIIFATYMMLEAASIDVASSFISYFDKVKAKEVFNIPDNLEIVCLLYLGYSDEKEDKPKKVRKELKEIIF